MSAEENGERMDSFPEQGGEIPSVQRDEHPMTEQAVPYAPGPGFTMLMGEENKTSVEVECVDMCSDAPIRGKLKLTNYRIFFSAAEGDPHEIDLPLHSIQKIEKSGGQSTRGEYRLDITAKHFQTVKFALNKQDNTRKDLYTQITSLAFPHPEGKVFAFEFKKRYQDSGWDVYDFTREYTRMGALKDKSKWRESRVNDGFHLIDTYPERLMVPASVSDEVLLRVSYFRSRGRIPALCWVHPKNEASISRCSQPGVGFARKRCAEDELMLRDILKTNEQSHKLYICDCRPKLNAQANQAKGKGFELEEFYENIEFSFGYIENIHEIRDSMKRLRDLVTAPSIDDTHWLSNLETTQWLHHIRSVLKEAVKVAHIIENKKSSVIVHCSDGWDRTAQVTGLAMLLLDPYYRTLQGFQVLIEKEWLSFGHKFGTRCAHGEKELTSDFSPIFIQFLDCVWQVTQQYPYVFQFNNYLLLFIAQHLHSCLFGTFLFDSEKERFTNEVKSKTQSLWSFINSHLTEFTNPLYKDMPGVILPRVSMRTMRLWRQYYMNNHPFYRYQDPYFERIMDLVHLREKLQQNCEEMRNKTLRVTPPVQH